MGPAHLTEAELAQLTWDRDDAARKLSKRLGIEAWVAINQYVHIDWSTWHQLDDLTQRAIGLEIEALAQERSKSIRDQESKLENMLTHDALSLKFPNATNSSIGRFLS